LALLIFGCGGGGSSGGNGGGTGTLNDIRVESVFAADPGTIVDPLNIQVGDTIRFQVVGYDDNDNRVILNASNWRTTDAARQAGQLTQAGVLTATASSNGTRYTVSANAAGAVRSRQYEVRPSQARVRGRVVDATSGLGIDNIQVRFYNDAGTVVGSVRTAFDGTFLASVPLAATRFHLDPQTVPNAYYNSYSFAGLRYAPTIGTCTAPLPPLSMGLTTNLPANISLPRASGPPPPPPTGCG
jgi:hypothetical protein